MRLPRKLYFLKTLKLEFSVWKSLAGNFALKDNMIVKWSLKTNVFDLYIL